MDVQLMVALSTNSCKESGVVAESHLVMDIPTHQELFLLLVLVLLLLLVWGVLLLLPLMQGRLQEQVQKGQLFV